MCTKKKIMGSRKDAKGVVYLFISVKDCLIKIQLLKKHDFGIMWIKISNELLHFNEDVYLFYVYNPPSNSKYLKTKI